jgi:hypothetical protein
MRIVDAHRTSENVLCGPGQRLVEVAKPLQTRRRHRSVAKNVGSNLLPRFAPEEAAVITRAHNDLPIRASRLGSTTGSC